MSFTTPTNYAADHVTTLRASFTSKTQTTGITGNPLEHNGANTDWKITGPQILRFSKGKYVEYIYFPSASVDSTTNVITWGTATRDVPWDDGGSTTSLSTGVKKWGAGTNIELVWTAQNAEQTAFRDASNTFTAEQIFSNGIRLTPFADTTARDAAIPSPTNGNECYVTGVGKQVYTGGSWVTTNAAGTSIASDHSAGSVDLASTTELAAGTANDATSGAANVVPVSSTTVTTSGSGKVPVLNSAGFLDVALGGTGTASPTSGGLLVGGGTSAMTVIGPGSNGQVPISNGTTIAMGFLASFFGNGSDGTPTWTSGASLDPTSSFNYTSATLPVSQTLTVSSTNTPLIIHTTGDVTINGTISLNSKGGAGASGTSGGGNAGTGGKSVAGTTYQISGGGAGVQASAHGGGGGGGGSFSTTGTNGTVNGNNAGATGGAGGSISSGATAALASLLRGVACGSGGGSGGGNGTSAGGTGGTGGGAMIWLIGGNLTLGSSSTITATGSAATAGTVDCGGGGGGGGGTVLILVAGTITNSGATLTAAGGSGAGTPSGGAGATGAVLIYSLTTGTLVTS